MKKLSPLFLGLAVVYLFFTVTNNLAYNFILSGAVAAGNQPLPAATVSVEFLSESGSTKQLYNEPSHFPGGGYDLNFPAKNNSSIILHYEKMGYGTLKKLYMLEGKKALRENSYVQLDLPIAHLFNFRRYENDTYVGSFNQRNMRVFQGAPELTARQKTYALSDINFFETIAQLNPISLSGNEQQSNAHWYSVTFRHKTQLEEGYILYENEDLEIKP